MSRINLEDYVIDGSGAVKVLDGWRLLELDEAGIYNGADAYSTEGIKLFRAWCQENSVAFYAAPKEEFFAAHGFDYAEKTGKTYLIMENLS